MFIIFSSNAAEKRYERRKMVHGPRIAQNAKQKKPPARQGVFARHNNIQNNCRKVWWCFWWFPVLSEDQDF